MLWINPSALLRLILLAALCVALLPLPAQAQSADDVIVLVDETFDNPGAGELQEREAEGARYTYERGPYVVEGIGQQTTTNLVFGIYDVVEDGAIAVDVRLRGSVDGRFVFVGCRDGGSQSILGYSLVVDLSNGLVALFAKQDPADGGDVQLTDAIYSDAIRIGNRTNRIELSCIGSTITSRINGAEVVSITDDQFQQGHFNAGAGLFSGLSGPVEGVFDNLLVTMVGTPDSSARRDARELDQFREEAQEAPSLFGPDDGVIRIEEEEFVGAQEAGVDVRDFYARATFANPYDVDEHRWDVGMNFRSSDDTGQTSLILRSTGRWYLSDAAAWPRASGLVPGMATGEGDENTIEVAVVGETGYLALNGEFLATFDASTRMTSGDVSVGSSFFRGDTAIGDRIDFRDFEVWGLGDDAAPEEPGNGQPRLPGPRDPDEPDEPTEEPDAADTVTVELHDMDQSGRSGQATLMAEGERTKVALRVRDVPGDTIVVLQEGPCTALNSESGFELRPLNDAGVSVTRIDAALADLLAEPHAIVVYDYDAKTGVETLPLVCGEITAS